MRVARLEIISQTALVFLAALWMGSIAAAQAPPPPPPGTREVQRPGQPPGREEAAPAGPLCSIEGIVIKQASGEPLKKARIILRKAEGQGAPLTADTTAEGRFTLKEVPAGRYRLSVERNGFVRQEYGQRAPGTPGTILALTPGQTLRDITFRMLNAGVITGRVFDEDGEPMQGVQVQAQRYMYSQGQRQLLPAGSAGTNDLGEYRIYGLAPGRYHLSARHSPNVMMSGAGGGAISIQMSGEDTQADQAYVPIYYPGTSDPGRAAPIDVAPGDEIRGMDFTFQPVPARRVRGTVFNAVTGQPGRGVMILLMPREGGLQSFIFSSRNMVQDPEGKFELRGVTPGSYLAVAMWFEEGRNYSGRAPVEVGATDVDNVHVVIAPGVDITGKVVVEGGQLEFSELRVSLQAREMMPMAGGSSSAVRSDGTFTLQNVAEDHFRVSVFGMPPEYFVKSVRLGSDDVTEKGVRVSRGQQGTLEVVVSAAGAKLEGLVVSPDQLPANGAQVTLVPDGDRRRDPRFYKTTQTDQFGRFTLRGISPGKYKVFAWEQIEPGAQQDPEFIRPYEDRGLEVTLTEGGLQNVELKLIPAKQGGF